MKHFHFLSLATVVALTVVPVIAQGQAASAPQTSAAKSMDCDKTTMKRHDRGAERGGSNTASSMQMNKPCPPEASASASKSTTKKGKRHDHGATKNN